MRKLHWLTMLDGWRPGQDDPAGRLDFLLRIDAIADEYMTTARWDREAVASAVSDYAGRCAAAGCELSIPPAIALFLSRAMQGEFKDTRGKRSAVPWHIRRLAAEEYLHKKSLYPRGYSKRLKHMVAEDYDISEGELADAIKDLKAAIRRLNKT